ncbi:MAG TPA: condensation domain-containing protein, partial [Thermoanaerobaculia bacterium]|nr:condensation domain-containing protein [Thermoanaerobaculia bacterium]
GARDDFFELGGHSLLGTRLLSRLRDELGVELPVATLFERPTVEALAEAIAARRAEAAPAAPPIVPVPREGDLPLSFAQERFWFLDRLEPDGSGYNMSSGVLLTGELSAPALVATLSEIVRRHESLRTVFPERNGDPVQLIQPPRPAPLPVIDLSALPAGSRQEELERRVGEEARRPFNLAAGPLLRTLLLRLADDEHALTFCAHHIVADMWSTGLMVREISQLYPAVLRGAASPLAELRVQYADFAAWQRRWLTGEVLDRLLSGWRARLEGAPTALEIPTDRPRPPVQTFRGASVRWRASSELTEALHRLAQDEGATLFMTLLAIYQNLLHRYSGQPEVVVGSPIAGRSREEVTPLIGVFINTLALRGDLSGNPTVRELLGRVREVALEAYALQDLPFERLVEELKPARDLARTPLFQAMLVLQNAPAQDLELPRLKMGFLPMSSGAAKFDLTLWMGEVDGSLVAALEYNTDLFEPGTAERMLGHFETLLAAAAADPARGIDDLPLLGAGERRQIVADWNATRTDWASSGLVHRLVQAQAEATPGAVAVVAGGVEVAYQALAGRVHRLAHHLRRLGVGLETRVGVCLERTADLPVALLAILEAGGCYVPLDPSYPRDRLAYMLEDSAAPVVITQESLREALPPHQAWVVSLDGDAPAIELETQDAPEADLDPANLAYVLYTSGSTGKPKGVQVPHGALVNFLLSMRERPGLDSADALLAVTPISFDIAGLELYLPLLAGARVVLATREE